MAVGFLGAGVDDADGEGGCGFLVCAGAEAAREDAEGVELQARKGAVVDVFGGVHGVPLVVLGSKFTTRQEDLKGICLVFRRI